ncbi:hypothetical protein MNBD_ALPHA01-1230 [hydrothermal vent metagenome]|uniref:Uncharacterized protein n=1 Tax=hydrothermal vent metagenome TaxID=652676 RepID=A0A3B0TG49_9ZZZZ
MKKITKILMMVILSFAAITLGSNVALAHSSKHIHKQKHLHVVKHIVRKHNVVIIKATPHRPHYVSYKRFTTRRHPVAVVWY